MNTFSKASIAFRHAERLIRIFKHRVWVEDLSVEKLKELGVDAVILDHDGVLGPSLSKKPDGTGAKLIRKMLEAFGPGKVFILSNTRRRRNSREKAYHETQPDVIYIKARRKPDPEGLLMASNLCGIAEGKIAVIDDGLLTGVLMALENGAAPVYVTRRKMDEGFFAWAIRVGTTWPQIAFVYFLRVVYAIS